VLGNQNITAAHHYFRTHRERGQAMAEFQVTVAFAFLPLFVIVPTIGKLIDINHENQMAARYAAWERTVWYDNLSGNNRDDFVQSGNEWESVAVRKESQVSNTVMNRFFQTYSNGPIKLVDSDDTGAAGDPDQWRYMQSSESMIRDVTVTQMGEQDTPGFAYAATELFADGVDTIMTPVNFLLGVIGNDNEDLFGFPLFTDPKGYYTPKVTTRLNVTAAHGGGDSYWDRENGEWSEGIESYIFQNWDGSLTARAGILTDGWSAQSIAHYKDRVDDYMPSDVFDNGFFDAAITIASLLEGGPANSAINKLDFGDASTNPIPLKDGEPAPVSCGDGICEFEE